MDGIEGRDGIDGIDGIEGRDGGWKAESDPGTCSTAAVASVSDPRFAVPHTPRQEAREKSATANSNPGTIRRIIVAPPTAV